MITVRENQNKGNISPTLIKKNTIAMMDVFSQCRRGHSFAKVQGCGGSKKPQTPTPWEHGDYSQLARHRPLKEKAPEGEKQAVNIKSKGPQ